METDFGTLLGGRVRHEQPAQGHRTGIEPVLLAAFVPARPGQTVLEGGTGSGAGLLCLAARVAGLQGTGIERDPAMAEIARRNLAANPSAAGFTILAADLLEADLAPVDHAFANPPWHAEAGTSSPSPAKEAAKRGRPGGIAAWIAALAAPIRDRGTLSLVVSAAAVPECLGGFATASCGSARLVPIWPRAGQEARLVLVQAVKRGRGAFRMCAGLVLHAAEGPVFSDAADAVLRAGAPLRGDGGAGPVPGGLHIEVEDIQRDGEASFDQSRKAGPSAASLAATLHADALRRGRSASVDEQ